MSLTFNSQRCCLHVGVTKDVKWNTISAVKWKTVHEHIVADALHSKKSSSALLVQSTTKVMPFRSPFNCL